MLQYLCLDKEYYLLENSSYMVTSHSIYKWLRTGAGAGLFDAARVTSQRHDRFVAGHQRKLSCPYIGTNYRPSVAKRVGIIRHDQFGHGGIGLTAFRLSHSWTLIGRKITGYCNNGRWMELFGLLQW